MNQLMITNLNQMNALIAAEQAKTKAANIHHAGAILADGARVMIVVKGVSDDTNTLSDSSFLFWFICSDGIKW